MDKIIFNSYMICLYVVINGFYLMLLFSCICLIFFCFYMLSTPSLGSLGVCLMKYSSVLQRYGIVLSSLDFNYEFSCWQTNAPGVFHAFFFFFFSLSSNH